MPAAPSRDSTCRVSSQLQLGGMAEDECGTPRSEGQFPRVKLARICHTLHQQQGRQTCQRRELESLIRLLQHACQVVHPGQSFLWMMTNLLCIACPANHHIHLNHKFTADLWWWQMFFHHGTAFMYFPWLIASGWSWHQMPPAAGVVEHGGKRKWFQLQWLQQAK